MSEKWQRNMSLFQLFNIVLLAVVFKVLFRRRFYVEHLVFSAHFLSFAYLLTLFVWPLYVAFGLARMRFPMMGVAIAIMCVYMYFAFRRFYGATKGKAIAKTIFGYAGVYVVSVLIYGFALVAAIVQVLMK